MIATAALLAFLAVASNASVAKAAARYVPGVTWQVKSVVTADFTCEGHKQQAILGFSSSEIVIEVFISGLKSRPETLRYVAKVRYLPTTALTTEDLDYDPREDPGYELPGFERSKSCKGLNLGDQETDSAHIYWDHNARRFDDWSR